MGEKKNNNNQNESPVARWLRNAVLGATMADLPAMMTASGWRLNEKGDYVLDQQDDPHVKLLRDNLATIGETAMTAPTVVGDITGVYNIIRHPRLAINTIKGTLKDATYFIKNPRAKKIYHGSSNNFNLNEARMGSEGNFGLHVTPDKAMAEEFVHNGGSLMEGYVTRKPDAVIPDIGSNDYRFLSNDFKVPEIHRVDGNMGEYYYSLDKGRDNKLFDILNKYGAKPNRYTTRRGQPVIETYKETTIPLRDEVFPTMSSNAIKKSEDLLSGSDNLPRTLLNERTANILSEDGKKLLEYHNVAEGNGGKSYIITDPNIIYTPKTNLDDITSYIGLGKYLPWGFILSNKKGSKILIKKKNRGKFTEYCGGEVTDKCILKAKKSGNSKLIKRAVFAQNARKWKHKEGGELERGSKKKLIKGETGFVNKRPIPGLLSNATSKKKQKAEEGVKIHKPYGHKSVLDNGWQSTKELKKKNRPIPINATGGPLENEGPSRNWDKTLTGKLINFSENPDSIGWDAKNRRWYAPPAGKGYDTNLFGMGVDRNLTPGFKERVKRDNKGREYLTADDERYLRHMAIDRANESANTRYKFAQKASKIKGAVSPKHDAITVSAIYNLGPGHMARTVFENSKAMKSIFNRNSPEYQNYIHKLYKLKGRNERIQNELKFFKLNGL